MTKKAKTGRPPKGPYEGKAEVANFRIRPDTKRLLIEAAAQSGRSLSQEIEFQLRRALASMGGAAASPTYAILQVIGRTLDSLVNYKQPGARWIDDPYLYGQAVKVMSAMFELLRPPGEVPQDTVELGTSRQGELRIAEMLRALQIIDTSKPFAEQTERERALTMLRNDLGELADRPRLYGRTAEQTRRVNELLREFVPLRRKAAADPDALSPRELKQMLALWDQLVELQGTQALSDAGLNK
jgi:hypothetical protein